MSLDSIQAEKLFCMSTVALVWKVEELQEYVFVQDQKLL